MDRRRANPEQCRRQTLVRREPAVPIQRGQQDRDYRLQPLRRPGPGPPTVVPKCSLHCGAVARLRPATRAPFLGPRAKKANGVLAMQPRRCDELVKDRTLLPNDRSPHRVSDRRRHFGPCGHTEPPRRSCAAHRPAQASRTNQARRRQRRVAVHARQCGGTVFLCRLKSGTLRVDGYPATAAYPTHAARVARRRSPSAGSQVLQDGRGRPCTDRRGGAEAHRRDLCDRGRVARASARGPPRQPSRKNQADRRRPAALARGAARAPPRRVSVRRGDPLQSPRSGRASSSSSTTAISSRTRTPWSGRSAHRPCRRDALFAARRRALGDRRLAHRHLPTQRQQPAHLPQRCHGASRRRPPV